MPKKPIVLLLLIAEIGFTQTFSWVTKVLFHPGVQSGQYPALVVDSSGNWHFFYWHPEANRLYHAMVSHLSESPVWHYVDSVEVGGYPYRVYLSPNGQLYIAYMAEVGGKMGLRLGRWDGTKWNIDRSITSRTFGPYGPYQRFVYPYSQPSLAIGETKLNDLFITVFSTEATYDMLTNCYHFSPPILFLHSPSGWISFNLSGSYPTFSGSQCRIERYGEWITYLPSVTNSPQLYCVAQRNGELWRFTGSENGTGWQRDSLPLDSLLHYFPSLSSSLREKMTFDGLSIMRTPDSITHLFYSTSDYYGANLGGSGKWGLIHLKITPSDSLIYSLIRPFGSIFYSNTSCTFYNKDTFYVTYTVPSKGEYHVAFTQDGGQTWRIDTLFTTSTAFMNAPIQIKSDTVAILCYDSKYDRLILYWQQVGDSLWNRNILTTSSKPGYYLTGKTIQWDSLAKNYHLAHFDLARHHLVFQTWDYDTLVSHLLFDDTTKTYSDIAIYVKDSIPCLVYVDDLTTRVKLARKSSASWITEVVDFSTQGISPQVAIDDNLKFHVVFTNATKGSLRYAWKSGSSWNYKELDTVGAFTGVFPRLAIDAQDSLHIVYAQMDSNALFYMKGKETLWRKEKVSDSLPVSIVYSLALYRDRPYIVFKEEGNNVLYFAWKDSVTGRWKREPITIIPQGNITNRIWLRFDAFGRPWVLYAYQNIFSGIGLATRSDSSWESISIPNPYQIGEEVWFDIPNNYLLCIGRSASLPAIVLLHTQDKIPSTFTSLSSFWISKASPKVYPNPFSTKIHILLDQPDGSLHVSLYTITGKPIPCLLQHEQANHYLLHIEESLSPGHYFLVITTDQYQWVKKLYKE